MPAWANDLQTKRNKTMKMTPETFAERLTALIDEAVSSTPIPSSRMVYELDMAHTRVKNLQLRIESQALAQEMARKIIPANGNLKIIPPAGN
jgi:hypothetical protein